MNVTERRLQLLSAGYTPIPLFGKTPPVFGKNNKRKGLPNWEKLNGVTREQIEMWARTWPDAVNTGILTKSMPTLDLDILNEEAARAAEDFVRERYEERGRVLPRIGKAPKRAIPFRTDEPFAKIVVSLAAPNGGAEKIEFLGNGQQVACFGTHPETHKLYSWHGGEPGQIKREELPHICEAEARQLVADIVDHLVRDFSYQRSAARPKKERKGNDQDGAGGGTADWHYLFDNIRGGRELHDSLRDLAAKLITSGTSTGAAVNQLRALMKASTAPHDARWKERYDEIPRLVDSAAEKLNEKQDEAAQAAAVSPCTIDETLQVFARPIRPRSTP